MFEFRYIMRLALIWILGAHLSESAPWTPENDDHNINQNPDGSDPSKYYGSWPNHTYHPSPASWRMPFYTLMLDRFSDSDPTNNDVFETLYEFDPTQVHFRHGGYVH
jgi:alpha-1,3-glucan synthase